MNCFLITTYNRPRSVKLIYDKVKQWGNVYVINDGGDNPGIPCIWKAHGGKAGYYDTVTSLWNIPKYHRYDYYFMIQDDMLPVDDMPDKAINLFESIPDPNKVCLNLYADKLRWLKPCWTGIPGVDMGEYLKTGWTDMLFMANRRFFEMMDFCIPNPNRDYEKNPELGSGTGSVISKTIISKGGGMYQVKKSLVTPLEEAYTSEMNPNRQDDIHDYN